MMAGKEGVGGTGEYLPINTRSHGGMNQDNQMYAQAANELEIEEYNKAKNSHTHDRNHDMPKTVSVLELL